jgi:hypothetical protein
MKHLLLHRFQGALIGVNIIYINRQQITPNQLIIETNPALIAGVNSLICPNRFDPEQWAKDIFIDVPSPDRAMLAMLPLMLFFHDDRIKLRGIITTVSHAWQLDWETCSSAVAIGYIISRSLTESFTPSTIISQLLAEITNLHPLLFQELSMIERLLVGSDDPLEHRAHSLHQVTRKLAATSHPIIASTVLAIYCFLSTPEDFSIATRRAYQIEDRSQLICALTGILAGTQNSLAGIPLNGYLATPERAWWLQAAASLLTAWAGVYHEHSSSLAVAVRTVAYPLSVASPQVMQRRD